MTFARSRVIAFARVPLAVLLVACRSEGEAPQPPQARSTATAPFVQEALADTHFHWKSATSAHFQLHADSATWASARLDSLGAELESARQHVLTALDEPDSIPADSGASMHAFLLAGPSEIAVLVGQPAGGWTIPEANTTLLGVTADAAPPLRHELAHVFTHRRWGPPAGGTRAGDWVSEGTAVYAVGGCAGAPLHAWAHAVAKAGLSTTLRELEARFDFSRAAPHLEAGSFVQFLRERYGMPGVRALWTDGLTGAAAKAGMTVDSLEAAWHNVVSRAGGAQASTLDPRGRVRCETGGPSG